MKKFVLLLVLTFTMSPLLNAAEVFGCREFAKSAADSEWGSTVNSEVEYYYAYAEWYDMCTSLN